MRGCVVKTTEESSKTPQGNFIPFWLMALFSTLALNISFFQYVVKLGWSDFIIPVILADLGLIAVIAKLAEKKM
jgi:hypothetical protein